MSAQTVDNLLKQVLALSPEEQGQIREKLIAQTSPAADEFGKMMREPGIGRPRPFGPRGTNPTLVRVEGKPLSEQLIEERR